MHNNGVLRRRRHENTAKELQKEKGLHSRRCGMEDIHPDCLSSE